MVKIAQNVTELIGGTPLVDLVRYVEAQGLNSRIVAKVESFNPAGSSKDRIALSMVSDAEKRGLLRPGDTIIEPTSGNTGIGLAMVAAVRGYKLILTMPDTMSEERRRLLVAYGAKLELTSGLSGMQGAIDRAHELSRSIPGSVILSQFDNPSNSQAHYLTTGEEIWNDTDGMIDIFVATVGTGGTISGTAKALKQHNPSIRIVAVEPYESPVLSGGCNGRHGIQGIGAGFVPANYDAALVDEILTVNTADAMRHASSITQIEGLFVGISSGAALCASSILARRPENKGKLIVTLLPDTGERYLSTW